MNLRLAPQKDFYGDEVLGEDFDFLGFAFSRRRFFLLGLGEPDSRLTLDAFNRPIDGRVTLAD